jgi:23S rRNA G2445 N2-methylase RlmL
MVHEGLEELAADEVRRDLQGDVRKTARGVVVFRLDAIDQRILTLRTTEDVFLLAWGTDELTYRATDLDLIQRWTARSADWQALLRIHHAIRPRPKGRPTYRLVTQMEGKHGYLRKHAAEALAKGLAGHIPDSWRPAEENASVEVWLSIDEATATCGVRLSDATMRHRTWKMEHRPASLRPTVAAAMVRAAAIKPGQAVLDPMCGAGTILAEVSAYADRFRGQPVHALGGDVEFAAVRAAMLNLRRLGAPPLFQWDARRLPLASESVDQVISNPPFGKQLSSPAEVGPLYKAMVREYDRVLKGGGQAVLLTSDAQALRAATEAAGWRAARSIRLRILGQPAQISVWRKAGG